jgi:hypothetical protein
LKQLVFVDPLFFSVKGFDFVDLNAHPELSLPENLFGAVGWDESENFDVGEQVGEEELQAKCCPVQTVFLIDYVRCNQGDCHNYVQDHQHDKPLALLFIYLLWEEDKPNLEQVEQELEPSQQMSNKLRILRHPVVDSEDEESKLSDGDYPPVDVVRAEV